jgi:cysteine-S-conjugate beta-lyase
VACHVPSPPLLHDRVVPAFDVDAIDLADLRQRQSSKYQVYEADVIPAWVAEMDFPLAAPVADALHAAIDRSDTGYRTGLGLADALVEFADRMWGWQIPVDRVHLIPDVLTGVAQSLALFTEPGDGVVINTPVYPPFFSTVRDVMHRTIVEVPMARAADGSYDWDLPAMEAAFARADVTAFVMSNPHNPTGSVPSVETLAAIAAMAEEHGVLVVSDEIHGPLTLPGADHVPYMSIAADDANAVILVSASKAWNLPGLKCAQLVSTARTAPVVRARLPIEVTYQTGHLGVIAAVAAYCDGGPWLDDVVAIIDGNRALLTDLLAEHLPRAGYVPPQASYLAWIDFRAYDLGDDPSVAFRERGRVALSAGPTFGTGGQGFARLNLATSPRILREIVRRMGSVVQ